MRLHHLRITAFGPFPGTVEVDLDELGSAGLFLLTGATGAGKTSVLDAVCFALYGDVPGDRADGRRLRCDLAAPTTQPRVRLELTVQGRRLAIERSPAWTRPKRRGTGTTTEPASAVLAEMVGGTWTTRSTRIDETGHLVGGLLGMTLAQFTQVAMLPQGRFQAFLRADSKDRQRLLQHLFRTGRFERVEHWLKERRGLARRAHDEAHHEVVDVVSRLSEAASLPAPDDWSAETVTAWSGDLTARAERAQVDAEGEAATAQSTAGAARQGHEAAQREHLRLARFRAAHERRDRVETQTADVGRDRRRLEAGRRAEPVAVHAALHTSALAALTRARTDLDERRREADRAGAAAGVDPGSAAEALAREAETVRALVPRSERAREARLDLDRLQARHLVATGRVERAGERLEGLPSELDAARTAHAEARRAVEALPSARDAVRRCGERLAARREADGLAVHADRAGSELSAARARVDELRRAVLDLREARLDGMAAELAGALVVGGCCPVCGSADHPARAVAAHGAPTRADERAAQSAADDAVLAETAHADAVRSFEQRLAVARDRCGDAPLADLEAKVDAAVAARDALTEVAVQDEPRADRVRRLDDEVAGLTRARDHDREERERLGARIGVLRGELAALEAALDGADDPGLLGRRATLLEAAAAAAQAHEEAREAAHRAAEAERAASHAVEEAASRAGFASGRLALAAVLVPAEADRLTGRVRAHDDEQAAVAALLAELGDPPGPDAAAPDLAGAAEAARRADDALAAARAAHAVQRGRATRLAQLDRDLAAALEAWRPLRDDLELLTRLSTLADGTSSDNEPRMRLAAYVLAYRLAQVVEAANVRLGPMSDQRYRLEHTVRRGAGENRGGLSLLVHDDWSGESRDPVTLSGGETFVVSLALALGLADVVAHESGGTELETLFVDEGFGSLDADTLEDVMDVLDALRAGGRVVGVVSHVAEMRDRIPARLEVVKSPRGSSLAHSSVGPAVTADQPRP